MIKIEKAKDMKPGDLASFMVDGQKVGIYRKNENTFYTFEDQCTHDGAPICDGHTEGELIVCPRHGAKFSMEDGKVMSMPATSALDVYDNQFRDGELYVDLDS